MKQVIGSKIKVAAAAMLAALCITILNIDLQGAEKHALLIGIKDYSLSGLCSLEGPENDMKLLRETLISHFNFTDRHIYMYTGKNATHSKLEKAFAHLRQTIEKGDFVYIHYSGHGSQTRDTDGDEFPRFLDQTWVPYGSRSPKAVGKDRFDITDDELHAWLIPILDKTENLVFVSDSCHSAGVTRSGNPAQGQLTGMRAAPRDNRLYDLETLGQDDAKLKKAILIGAVQDGGIACEARFKGKIYGLFSWFWLEALRDAEPGETWDDLFKRAAARVTNMNQRQHPQLQGNAAKLVFSSKGNGTHAGYDSNPLPPRIPIVKVWEHRRRVRLDGGLLAGIRTGTRYELYQRGKTAGTTPLRLEIKRVREFDCDAEIIGTGTLRVGDLVHEIKENQNHGGFEPAPAKTLCDTDGQIQIKKETVERPFPETPIPEPRHHTPPEINVVITLWEGLKPIKTVEPLLENATIRRTSEGVLTFAVENKGKRDYYGYLLKTTAEGITTVIHPTPRSLSQAALLPTSGHGALVHGCNVHLNKQCCERLTLLVTEKPLDTALMEFNANENNTGPVHRNGGKQWGGTTVYGGKGWTAIHIPIRGETAKRET